MREPSARRRFVSPSRRSRAAPARAHRAGRWRSWVALLVGLFPNAALAAPPSRTLEHPSPPQPGPREPSGAHLLLERGRSAQLRGRTALALRHFSEAVRLAPTLEQAYLHLAQIRLQMGNAEQAREVLRVAIARARPAPNAQAELAQLEHAVGRRTSALSLLRQACETTDRLELWQQLAQWYLQERNHPAALSVWRHLSHHPRVPPDADVSVAALRWLSAELDSVSAGSDSDDWVRRSLAKLDRRAVSSRFNPPRPAP